MMAFQGQLLAAAIWIIVAALFDFLDGFAARLLKAYSPMGKELDSLSDMVSFGVAPGMVLFALLREAADALPWGQFNQIVPYFAFVIPVFSALRLAKFNIDERQTTSFIGMPVPAHALFWSSLAYSLQPIATRQPLIFVIALILLACASSYLLVSEIPMFSLKVKSLKWRGNEMRYLLVIGSLLFVLLWGFLGIAGAILLYLILSIFNKQR